MKRASHSLTSFRDLKIALESRKGMLKTLPEETRGPQERSDEDLFLEAMSGVREISEFREIPVRRPPRMKPCPRRRGNRDKELLEQIVRGQTKIRLSDTDEYMEWTGPRIRRDITKRLHEGGFSVQDGIDLHGMTLVEAEEALTEFFRDALRRRLCCVKVIHGRGLRSPKGPVIKEALKSRLQGSFRKWVLAFVTAKDCDGGLGATYVLLRQG
ncbi:MAG TPA: Smr/MutS family protein [Thermodesulfovibrionales bacterium]|jgi:DNA-nicking Smr family endonuclease|nr:Smr/MutS family protein [Thermodesulfovibrionales bacterium]